MPTKTYCWAIIDAMREEMTRDDKVFLIGEDVAAAGGAFLNLAFQQKQKLLPGAIVFGHAGLAVVGFACLAVAAFLT